MVTGGAGSDSLSVYDLRKVDALPSALRYGEEHCDSDDDAAAAEENGAAPANGAAGEARPTTALLSQTDITRGASCGKPVRRTVRCSGRLVACAGESPNVTVLRAALGPGEAREPVALGH